MKFYVYMYLKDNGVPFYVGKGSGARAYDRTNHRAKAPKNREQILLEYYPTENDAFFAEKFLIALYGRKDQGTGCLWNLTDGGEGPTGKYCSPETRIRLRLAGLKRAPKSLETRRKLSASLRGKKKSPEHVENVRQALIGIKRPYMIERNKKGPTPEIREKMSEAAKRRWLTKPPKRGKGLRKHSEETRAKMRAAYARRLETHTWNGARWMPK
jgi:hypothetical protein